MSQYNEDDPLTQHRKTKAKKGRRYVTPPAEPPVVFTPEEIARVLRPVDEPVKVPDVRPQFPPREAPDPSKLTDIEAEEFRAVLYEIHSRKHSQTGSALAL